METSANITSDYCNARLHNVIFLLFYKFFRFNGRCFKRDQHILISDLMDVLQYNIASAS